MCNRSKGLDVRSRSLSAGIRYTLGERPHPVLVTIRDNRDYIRVLLYSYYTTITGWGVLLRYTVYG